MSDLHKVVLCTSRSQASVILYSTCTLWEVACVFRYNRCWVWSWHLKLSGAENTCRAGVTRDKLLTQFWSRIATEILAHTT